MLKEELEAIIASDNLWAGRCTALLAIGILGEYVVLPRFEDANLRFIAILFNARRASELKQRLKHWSTGLKAIFALMVVLGIVGEHEFSARIATNAQKLQQEADRELADAATFASIAIERASDADRQTEDLKQSNLTLQAEILRLRQEGEPRRLTGAQRDRLVRLLNGTHGAVVIVSRVLDTESSDFADDLNVALHDGAHWETFRIRNRISSWYGVSLGTVAGTPFAGEAIPLNRALTAIGIAHDNPTFVNGDASTTPAFQAGTLYLVIEQKPLPTPRQ